MKLFENIKEWVVDIKNIYLQSKLDKRNRELFKQTIQDEYNDRMSEFNKFNLRADNDYTEIGYVIDIPEEYQTRGQEWQIMDKLNENGYFISIYLQDKLGFREYVSEPSYFHIEDPNDTQNVSCSYLATWTYRPILTHKQLKKLYIIEGSIIGSISAIIGTALFLLL